MPGLKRSRWTRFRAQLAGRFGWAWQPLLYAGMLLGFFLSRALPDYQGHLAPLGVAFYAAVRGAGLSGPGALAVALSVVAGGASISLPQAVWIAAAVAGCHLLAPVFRLGRDGASPLRAAAVSMLAMAGPAYMVWGRSNLIQGLFLAVLSGVLAIVFTLGVAEAARGRFLRAGSPEAPVPAIVLLGAALCGMQGLSVGPGLSLRDVAAGLVVLSSAYVGGPTTGAAAGAVLGIVFLLATFGHSLAFSPQTAAAVSPLSMTYVVAGMVAGTFRELRKPGVGLAYCLGFLTYAAATLARAPELLSVMFSAMAATVLFWLTPRSWLQGFPAGLTPAPAPQSEEPEPEPVPAGLLERIAGMSHVFKEVGRSFEQVATVEVQPDAEPAKVFEQVAGRVCSGCSMYRHCWEKEYDRTQQLYADLWAQIERDGPLSLHRVPAVLEQNCIRPDQVAFTLNHLSDLYRSHHYWERRIEDGRTVVADYLRNVSRMLDRFVEEAGQSAAALRPEAPAALKVIAGVARIPKKGSHISGDSYAAEPLGAGRYFLALSDGMGVGRAAANESKQCVTLLRDILKAGFATDVAVRTVNSALLLHSPEESFATVDLSLLDLSTGRAEFVKVGAAPSFVKRGSDVTMVRMSSVPVGIINQVEVEPEFRLLRPGDLLVMLTDGVWDAVKTERDKERWLLDFLSRESSTDPEEIAESILARTVELTPEVEDDLTVLVARIDSADGAPPAKARRPSGADWVPLRRAPGRKGDAAN